MNIFFHNLKSRLLLLFTRLKNRDIRAEFNDLMSIYISLNEACSDSFDKYFAAPSLYDKIHLIGEFLWDTKMYSFIIVTLYICISRIKQ